MSTKKRVYGLIVFSVSRTTMRATGLVRYHPGSPGLLLQPGADDSGARCDVRCEVCSSTHITRASKVFNSLLFAGSLTSQRRRISRDVAPLRGICGGNLITKNDDIFNRIWPILTRVPL
jgi:hypothetical protein